MSKTIWSGIASAILVALVLAVYLWVFSDYNQGASAQEVVGGACAKMEATTDYDVVGTRLRTTDGYAVPPRKYEAKISGKDYHVKTSNQDGSDMVEAIWLDGISYRKYHDYENQWYIAEGDSYDITSAYAPLGDNPVCPTLSPFRSTGTETTERGVSLRRFTNAPRFGQPAFKDVIPGVRESKQHEILVKSTGELSEVRIRNNVQVEQNGRTIREALQFTVAFREIGVPNVITAPCSAPCPEPVG